MTTASAPGKIILFGEHAVVYGRPALAVPVTELQAQAEVSDSTSGVWIDAPDIKLHAELAALGPDDPLRTAIYGVFHALAIVDPPSLNILISATIPPASGLGSGAAVSIALIRALSAHLGRPLPDEQVNALAFEVEKIHHGTPSGIDNTVITYARPVYFVKGQPIETLQVGAPFTIVIADTGIPAPTRESVGDLRRLWEADRAHWDRIFDNVGDIVWRARTAIEMGEIDEIGPLMDVNHALLKEMTVSSIALDRLVSVAWGAGAEGAKLSGGGRGGNMIALVRPESATIVAEALLAAGAKNIIITSIKE